MIEVIMKNTHLKPALKWPGGKRWLAPQFCKLFPFYKDYRWVEPFCGGLGLTLSLLPEKALLSDIFLAEIWKTKKIIRIASEALEHFESIEKSGEKDGGKKRTVFVTRPDAPQWVVDMCYRAHEGSFPCDYVYEYIVETLNMIIDCESDGQIENVLSKNITCDVNTCDLIRWLAEAIDSIRWVDTGREESGPGKSILDDLEMGQYLQRKRVADLVYGYLKSMAENSEDNEEESEDAKE